MGSFDGEWSEIWTGPGDNSPFVYKAQWWVLLFFAKAFTKQHVLAKVWQGKKDYPVSRVRSCFTFVFPDCNSDILSVSVLSISLSVGWVNLWGVWLSLQPLVTWIASLLLHGIQLWQFPCWQVARQKILILSDYALEAEGEVVVMLQVFGKSLA